MFKKTPVSSPDSAPRGFDLDNGSPGGERWGRARSSRVGVLEDEPLREAGDADAGLMSTSIPISMPAGSFRCGQILFTKKKML